MIAYSPVPLWLGQASVPTLSTFPFIPPSAATPDGATNLKELFAIAGLSLLGLGITVGGTWIGIRTGIQERGFLSLTGWTVGIVLGLAALSDLAGLILAGAQIVRAANK